MTPPAGGRGRPATGLRQRLAPLALAALLAACSDGVPTGVWAPDAAACAPGSPGRLVIGRDFIEETSADAGVRRVFAVVRRSVTEEDEPRLTAWFEFPTGPGFGIFRWTFTPLGDDRLRRIEVATGTGNAYTVVDRPVVDYVRCPDGAAPSAS